MKIVVATYCLAIFSGWFLVKDFWGLVLGLTAILLVPLITFIGVCAGPMLCGAPDYDEQL